LSGETGPDDVVLDDDFKTVLHALVRLVAEEARRPEARSEVKRINEFLRRIRWRSDNFGEKAELLRELDLHQARIEVLGRASSAGEKGLPPGDVFRKRPAPETSLRHILSFERAANVASKALAKKVLDVAFQRLEDVNAFLESFDFGDLEDYGAMLLAVKDLGVEIARDPIRLSTFASLLLMRIEKERPPSSRKVDKAAADRWLYLRAWTHRLAAMARLQAGDFPGAGPHLRTAYKLLAKISGSEFDFASVEIVESQRRTFMGKAHEGITLAKRAERTYRSLGLGANVARAKVAQGMALGVLGRHEAAVTAYLEAVPEFEKQRLWSNYIGALNSLGLVLTRLGRFEQARSAYAKALRRFSRDEHSSWMPLVRHGLAELLSASGRYIDAAHSFRDVKDAIRELPFGYWHLKWGLQEIETWARAGEVDRARVLLEELSEEAKRQGVLESRMLRRLKSALSGKNPSLERLGALREESVRGLVNRTVVPRQDKRSS
jgi:tetratricopeptide (TPR) repeat protein